MTAQRDDFRDEALARMLRAHADETPPAAVDDAIRAAARRAVASRPGSAFRAWRPLAAAAVLALVAFGIVTLSPHRGDPPVVLSDATLSPGSESVGARALSPEPLPAAPRPPSITAEGMTPAAPPTAPERQRQDAARAAPSSPPLQAEPAATAQARAGTAPTPVETSLAPPVAARNAAPVAAPPVAADPPGPDAGAQETAQVATADAAAAVARAAPSGAGEGTVKPAVRERPEGESAIDRDTAQRAAEASEAAVWAREPSRAGAPARSAASLAARREPPAPAPQGKHAAPVAGPPAKAIAQFIADIRRHLAAGERDAAARELRAFRAAYADADRHLPEDLQPWAAGTPR